jgi:hypothetical protein
MAISRKVRCSSGLFDQTSQTYGRPRYSWDGLIPDSLAHDREPRVGVLDQIRQIQEHKMFLAATVPGALSPGQTRLIRVKKRGRIGRRENRPHWSRRENG